MTRHATSVRWTVAGVAAVLLGGAALRADDEKTKTDEEARQRLEFMKAKLDTFTLSTEKEPDRPLPRTKEPVIRYSNPTRTVLVDAAIFVWHSGDRPAAAASVWIDKNGGVHREFVSLSGDALRCVRDGKTVWSPQAGAFSLKPLPDAPKPAATPALRLTQMRRTAERFSGTFEIRSVKGEEELRMMPQPIHRYTADKGTPEGAIFALAHNSDPEVLVVLELASPKPGEPPVWSYGIARMSSARMKVSFDKKEVWSTDFYWGNPRSADDPYMEALDGKLPGSEPAKKP